MINVFGKIQNYMIKKMTEHKTMRIKSKKW